MHACLKIPEIISNICELALDDDDLKPAAPADIRAVASFARSCSAIYTPANHALWGTVTHLAILVVSTMPKGLWKKVRMPKGFEDYSHELRPTRAIKEKDLERLRFYAPLIHTMHIGLNWSIELSVEGYEAVFEAAGEDKLFPRLRAVAWNADYVDFNLVNCVLSPSLKNLHFATDSLDVADIEILRDVQEACPGIQRLRYGATQDAKAEHEAVKELVKLAFKFPLVAFSAACVEQSDIPFLATQRSLRKLAIDIGVLHKKGAGVPLWELPQQSFSFINELSLQFPLSLTACKHLLRSSSFLELRALALRPHQLTPQRLASFLQTLRKAIVRPDLLERLDIFEGGPSQWDATTAKPLHEQELTPLLDFPSLTHLVLCSSSDVDISEEMLASMATAWPNLQTLFIYSRCSARKAPLLHVRDLHHIVWGCRHLERLAIRVSAEEEPILTDELPEFGFEHPLKELAISSAPIAQADIVATVIGTYFPRLQTLSWSDEGRDSDRWEHLMFDLGEQVQKKSWKEYLNR